jgi:hypothetical protein
VRGIDWERMWVPQVSLLEVFLRASLVYLVAHLVLRLAGRKELARYSSFNVAVLFLVTIALRRSITVDDASLTAAFLALAPLVTSWVAQRYRPSWMPRRICASSEAAQGMRGWPSSC